MAAESVLWLNPEVTVYRIPPRASSRGHRAADWKLHQPDWTGRLRVTTKGDLVYIKLEDRVSGRHAFIGVGFSSREDAFDFSVTVQEHFRCLKQKMEAAQRDVSETAEPKLDLAFKEGETIQLQIGNVKRRDRSRARAAGAEAPVPLLPPPGGKTAGHGRWEAAQRDGDTDIAEDVTASGDDRTSATSGPFSQELAALDWTMAGGAVCFTVVMLSAFLTLVVVSQETTAGYGDTPDIDYPEYMDVTEPPPIEFPVFPEECREEQYPCTRLYSVHQPLKQCIHKICFYSLRRMYVVNKEICIRTVCLQEEKIKADLCRTQQGWPRRYRRNNRGRSHIRCNDVLP
ncbi:uncharacterized protein [Heterodontus francisci]|uniref:uncharacterized protein isoform X2 n=1 Tax=Heterodontus francisci TaxID=7792 RepID=UPI00355B3577